MSAALQVFSTVPSVLRVSGTDAATFLQGQFTNDLRSNLAHPATPGLWLNAKGKVVAESVILRRRAEEFLVVSLASPAAVIRERLETYVIADDVAIEDQSENMTALVVFGGGELTAASACLGVSQRGEFSEREGGCAFGGIGGHAVWFGPTKAGAELSTRLRAAGVVPSDADAFTRWRIRAGVPAVPTDLGPTDLPQEGGLERDFVSFNKGCYLGQEVMARLFSMGQVRRTLVSLAGDGAPPAGSAPVFAAGKQIGELRGRVADGSGFVAFAMVQRAALATGAAPCLQVDGTHPLRVLAPEVSRG